MKARYNLHQMVPSAIRKSIEDFQQAIQMDANYAPAHAGLASAYALLAIAPFDLLPPHEAMPKAEDAARKALQLDNSLAEAHTALALVNHHYHWKWKEAEEGYEQAIELNPDHGDTHLWYSWMLLALGRRDAAFAEIEQTMSIVQETEPAPAGDGPHDASGSLLFWPRISARGGRVRKGRAVRPGIFHAAFYCRARPYETE